MNATLQFPVGVEIETRAIRRLRNLPATFSQGEDGSCGSEFRSIKIEKSQNLFDAVTETCRHLQANDAEISSRCGLHVHVGFKQIGDLSAKYRLFRFVSCYENLFFELMPPWQERAKYCTKLSTEMWDSFRNGQGFDFWNKNEVRRLWFNGAAMKKHGTVEFRHMNGTIDESEILGWVAVLQCMFHAATNLEVKLDWMASHNVSPTTLIRDLHITENKIFGCRAESFILRKAVGHNRF